VGPAANLGRRGSLSEGNAPAASDTVAGGAKPW
jgi:hypothetical protein